jgi:glycosyltransferase involved in cell wall biosynthesis
VPAISDHENQLLHDCVATPRRLLVDVSTTVRWSGSPVGIVRVERELALWALENRPDAHFVVFDPTALAYRELRRFAFALISDTATLDTFALPDPANPGRRRSDRVPRVLRPAYQWIFQFRRRALRALEQVRLQTRSASIAATCDRLQRVLMKAKDRKVMIGRDGARRPLISIERALGDFITLQEGDDLIAAGAGWSHCNIDALAERKRETGFRLVLLVHDLIPIQFPSYYKQHDLAAFERYMRKAIPLADLIVTGSERVAADIRRYREMERLDVAPIAVTPFGADPVKMRSCSKALPSELVSGRYALLVSTIEPRKGHLMIYETWLQLLAAGVPQAPDFKLVFVGRSGWLVDDMLSKIRSDPHVGENLLICENVDDAELAALYHGAAFCLYPSVYEGYGLPVVEAFFHGKAVLASTGGAIPEIVGTLSPCLDPNDGEAWYRMLKMWIEEPEARRAYEAAIRENFHHPTWKEAAAMFFARVAGEGTTRSSRLLAGP